MGNRLTETALGGAAKTYTYDAANRLTSADGVSYTWDNNGNLLDDGAHTYTYDHANRLKAVSNQQSAVSYGYNGLGDRLQQTANSVTTSYTLDLNTGLTQVLSDGTNTYLYGAGRIAQQSAAGKEYFLGDALGSVRQLTNSDGGVSLARSYQPYGKLLASDGSGVTSYGFTGEWADTNGLVYLRARYFAPQIGRFTTKDAWQGNDTKPMSYNAWLYVYANPVNLTDPSGYYCLDENLDGRCDPGWQCFSIRDQAVRERCLAKYCFNSIWVPHGIPNDIPLYGQGNDMYKLYEKYWKTEGWWNNNTLHMLTIEGFVGVMLSYELDKVINAKPYFEEAADSARVFL